jgi:hypothetical protein
MMRIVWMILAAAVVACSSPSIELDELDAAGQASRCTRFVRCGLFASVDACNAYARIPPPSSYAAAKDAGKLSFDGEEAKRCEDALAQQGCDLTSRDVRTVPAACAKRFHGKIADGDACSFDEECESSRCDQGTCPSGSCCVGMCGETRSGGKPGDACDRDTECTDGFCGTEQTCHALEAKSDSCVRDAECGYNLVCISPSPSIPGSCEPLPHVGEACPYQRCADLGTYCDATRHCAPIGLPGDPCTAYGDCSPFAECDLMNHVCIPLPTRGMPCDVACAGESWCNFNDQAVGICDEPQPNGTPCEDSGKCLSQNCKPGTIFDSCQDYPICP